MKWHILKGKITSLIDLVTHVNVYAPTKQEHPSSPLLSFSSFVAIIKDVYVALALLQLRCRASPLSGTPKRTELRSDRHPFSVVAEFSSTKSPFFSLLSHDMQFVPPDTTPKYLTSEGLHRRKLAQNSRKLFKPSEVSRNRRKLARRNKLVGS